MSPVIITRPSPDGEKTVAALKAAHIEAVHCPIMRIDIDDQAPPPDFDFAALAFTSANGVRAYAEQQWARLVPAYCVGEASATAAQAAGFDIAAIGQGDVQALAEAIAAHPPTGPILHARGADAAGDLVTDLRKRAIMASSIVLYRADPLPALPHEAVDALRSPDAAIAFFSPRTVRLFISLLAAEGLSDTLGAATAFCLSPAVAKAAQPLRFGHVHTATAPSHRTFVDMVISVRT